jgi:hypothetical protein
MQTLRRELDIRLSLGRKPPTPLDVRRIGIAGGGIRAPLPRNFRVSETV